MNRYIVTEELLIELSFSAFEAGRVVRTDPVGGPASTKRKQAEAACRAVEVPKWATHIVQLHRFQEAHIPPRIHQSVYIGEAFRAESANEFVRRKMEES
jgi:hypothetical protein